MGGLCGSSEGKAHVLAHCQPALKMPLPGTGGRVWSHGLQPPLEMGYFSGNSNGAGGQVGLGVVEGITQRSYP